LEIFRIANNVNTSLRHIVIPYLRELVKIYKETANLVIFQDLSVLYLEKVESSYSMRISTTVGGEKPLHCTAVGKSILAFLPEDDLIDKIKRMDFHRFTERTITTPNKLIESLKDIRKIGYAEEDEELEIGLHCIAAPIFNKYNIPFAAISLSGPVSRMNSEILADNGQKKDNIRL
jgi:DNA-binding IclR family transcriptional regulator